jgi:hypothetical protein
LVVFSQSLLKGKLCQDLQTGLLKNFNPAQTRIAQEAGTQIGSESKVTYRQAFQKLESVNSFSKYAC